MPSYSVSFITVIKNRTKVDVNHGGKVITLKLFENNLRALIKLIKPTDNWEYIIVDFNSTDVNMSEFLETLPKKDNLKFRVITLDERFDKGHGLNIAVQHVSNDIVFFNDADMLILTRDLFDDMEKLVVQQNKVLFPICWSYESPDHALGWKREGSKGHVIQQKSTIVPYTRNKSWGMEDIINFKHYDALQQVVRTYYGELFVHQWHPNGDFKTKYYTAD
jgi:glycosyltransferase involved in cell wall biosynthesis